MVALQQHPAVVLAGALDRFLHLGTVTQVHRHAHALLAIHRLDHHAAMFGEEGGVLLRRASQPLRRQADPGVGQGAVGQALVRQSVMLTAEVRSDSDSGNAPADHPG